MQSRGFLQSNEWAEFQRSLGREVLEYDKEGITAKIIKHDLSFHKNYLYIPRGPGMDFNQMTGGLKNPAANFVRWLREESEKRKSIFIKSEPLTDNVAQALVETGFRKSKRKIQPARTAIVDLTKSEDGLLTAMHHKTRYNIGIADKHGVVIGEGNDLDVFLKLLKKTAKRDGFSPHADHYYKNLLRYNGFQIKLYFASHNRKHIAAALVLIYGDVGYYLHGASDYEYRALMAPYALHWHIMKQLKIEGLNQYDFWGVDAKKWPGVTRFKLGWGGRTIEYPGSFDLTISGFWHVVYKIASKLL